MIIIKLSLFCDSGDNMEFIKISLIFFLGIIDGIIFFIIKPEYLIVSVLVHIIIYLIIHKMVMGLSNIFLGVPNYLALFLPGLGGVIISVLYFSLFYFQRDGVVLNDYERYLEFEHFFGEKKKLDYKKEMEILSFNDQMKFFDSTKKKKLIVDYSLGLYGSNINLLQKGVKDEDIEVRHYSAVTINMIENNFTNSISQLREEYTTYHSIDSLIKLSEMYNEYLSSGLVSEEMLTILNKEYIEILLKLIEKNKYTLEVIDSLVKAYIRNGNLIRAEEFNNKLINNFPDNCEGIINQINIAYERRAFNEITLILKDVKSKKDVKSNKLKEQLSFWIAKEEIL